MLKWSVFVKIVHHKQKISFSFRKSNIIRVLSLHVLNYNTYAIMYFSYSENALDSNSYYFRNFVAISRTLVKASSYILEDRKRYITIDRRNKYVVIAPEMRAKIYGIEIGFVQRTRSKVVLVARLIRSKLAERPSPLRNFSPPFFARNR